MKQETRTEPEISVSVLTWVLSFLLQLPYLCNNAKNLQLEGRKMRIRNVQHAMARMQLGLQDEIRLNSPGKGHFSWHGAGLLMGWRNRRMQKKERVIASVKMLVAMGSEPPLKQGVLQQKRKAATLKKAVRGSQEQKEESTKSEVI